MAKGRDQIIQAAVAVRLQLIILGLLISLELLWRTGSIPSMDVMAGWVRVQFVRYGLIAVVCCAFLENLAVFNAAFPGSVVMLIAMAATGGRPLLACITFVCIVIPSIAAHMINFFVGRLDTQAAHPPSFREFLASFWHPHWSALACMRAGKTGMRTAAFIRNMMPAALVWYAFWGILMYRIGNKEWSPSGWIVLTYLYLAIWMTIDVFRVLRPKADRG